MHGVFQQEDFKLSTVAGCRFEMRFDFNLSRIFDVNDKVPTVIPKYKPSREKFCWERTSRSVTKIFSVISRYV